MKSKNFSLGILCLFILTTAQSYSQIFVPYSTRYQSTVKGDFQIIGNNILNRKTATETTDMPYDGTDNNGNFQMDYIDIDTDPTTFCSSSANFTIPDYNSNCNKIKIAILYWGATLQSGSRTEITKIKIA